MSRDARVGVAVLLLLSGPAAPAVAMEPFVEVEAGGGFEGNLNAAPTSSEAKGSALGFASTALGIGTEPERIAAQASLLWGGTFYADYDDLSVNRLSLATAVVWRPDDRLVGSLAPSLGGSFYGDPDRNGLDLGLGIGLRWSIQPRISLRPGYRLVYHEARASEFDRTAHRFSLALGARAWPGGYVEIRPVVELGQVVRYLPAAAGGGGGDGGASGGRPNETFGSGLVADREDSTSAEVRLRIEQELAPRVHAGVGAEYGHVSTDPKAFDYYSANASVRLSWP